MDQFVVIYLIQLIIVGAMDRLLELIYEKFISELKDLQIGHMLNDDAVREIWDMINAYELLDSNMLSLKEKKQILDYYD